MKERKFKTDLELLEELKEKAAHRELGVESINYYYALKHALEILTKENKKRLIAYVTQGN